MTLLMRDMENMRKGTEIGEKWGAKQMGELAKRLIEDDRTEDIRKATEDEKYRQKLYKEYNISYKREKNICLRRLISRCGIRNFYTT